MENLPKSRLGVSWWEEAAKRVTDLLLADPVGTINDCAKGKGLGCGNA